MQSGMEDSIRRRYATSGPGLILDSNSAVKDVLRQCPRINQEYQTTS